MRNFSPRLNYLAIFVLLFSAACSKTVKSKSKINGNFGPTSNLACRFTPGFSTFDGNSFIGGFPNNAPYEVEYVCEKDGTVVAEAECRNPAKTNVASSLAYIACPGQGTIEIPAGSSSGLYNLAVKGKDPDSGVVSGTNVYNFAIDREAPYVTNSVVMLSKTTNSFSVDFNWIEPSSSTAPASGIKTVECFLGTSSVLPGSPTWSNCDTTQFSATGLTADTQYWVHFRLEDKAGNLNQDSSAGIKFFSVRTEVDGGGSTTGGGGPEVPGVCSITSSFANGFTSSSSVTLSYDCPNPNLTNRCILYTPGQTRSVNDGGTESGFQNCDETAYQRSITQNGSYQFCVADGEAGPVRCQTFARDTIVPTVSITNHSITATSASISFSGQDNGSGISRFTCALVKRGANSSETVFNALGQVVPSITAALDNSSIPCGATGVTQTSIGFDSSIIEAGTEYLFYVRSFDNAGLKSVPANQTLLNTNNQLACVISPKLSNQWKSSANQSFNYECTQWNPVNVSVSCQVENTAGGETRNLTCNDQAPECLTTLGVPSTTMCTYRGTFQTGALVNPFVASGDTLRVRVVAQDRAASGAMISSASDTDTFRLDTQRPLITSIDVHASSSEVQLSFAAQDPNAPLRGSGLKSDLGIKVFEIIGSSAIELLDYDLDLICSGVTVNPSSFDIRSNCNDLRFGPRNFNPAKNYRVDLTVEDGVGRTFTGSSLVFPGPNPNAGPTCSLELVSGFSVNPASPTSSNMTSTRIVCNNPFEEAPVESEHTTRAMCRVTTPDGNGNPVIGNWTNCTGSNANLVNDASFTWNIFNEGRNPGQVKLEVHGCDSTYTYRCGPISSSVYYFGYPAIVVPGWGAQTIEYFNGDNQTQHAQKLCNNPAPAPGGPATCALDTFSCVTTPCYQWQYGALVNSFISEKRKLGTCRTEDYIFDNSLGRCVARPLPPTCPVGQVLENGVCVAECSGNIVLTDNQVITGVVGSNSTCSLSIPSGVSVVADGHVVLRAKNITINGMIDGQGRGSRGGHGGVGGSAGAKPGAGIAGIQGASGFGRGGAGGTPGLGGATCHSNPCTGGSGMSGLAGANGLHANAKGVLGGGGGGGGGGGAGGYGRERASCRSSTSYGYNLEPGGAGGGGAGGKGGAAIEIYTKNLSGNGTIRVLGVQSAGNGIDGFNATHSAGGAGGAGGLATSVGTSYGGDAGSYTSCRSSRGGLSGNGARGGRGGDGSLYIQYNSSSANLNRIYGNGFYQMVQIN